MGTGGEAKFTHERPWACAILGSVTITSKNHVQSGLGPIGLRKFEQNDDPIITAVTAKEPKNQVNLYSTLTEIRAKVEGGSEGGLKLREGHYERLRFFRKLDESVLQRGDGSGGFGNADEYVRVQKRPKRRSEPGWRNHRKLRTPVVGHHDKETARRRTL